MGDHVEEDKGEQQEPEEIVEVEPEIVYFTDEVDSNLTSADQEENENDDGGQSNCNDEEIMPVMPFDLSSSYIYLIGDTDVNIEDCEADSNDGISYENEEDEDLEESNENLTSHCDICQQDFRDSEDLKSHYETFHVTLKKPAYCCHICNKTFSSSALLQAHDQSPCADKKKIQCKECGAEFASTYLFSYHFKIEHEKKLVCVVCQKVHTSEAALMHHLQVHDQPKYVCEKCDVKCDTIYELISHSRSHKKQTLMYACNKCDAAFSVVPELAFHIRQAHGKYRKVENVV